MRIKAEFFPYENSWKIGHIAKSKQSLRFDDKSMYSRNWHFFVKIYRLFNKTTIAIWRENSENSSDSLRVKNNHCDLTKKFAFQISTFYRENISVNHQNQNTAIWREKKRRITRRKICIFIFNITFFKLDFGNIVNTDFRVGGNDLNVVSTVKYFQK